MKNATPSPPSPGRLYVVATPIGNLEDITLRAIRILKEVFLVASEDTRHTRKLLSHLGISTKLFSYYKDREARQADRLIAELLDGHDIALVSDAGTPAVSDPGALLVKKCHELTIAVIPVPGPSALTAAVSSSGFTSPHFTFLGFLPSKSGQRRKLLTGIAGTAHPVIFYESPRRLIQSLEDCLEKIGDRQVYLGRELTKLHEELLTGSISTLLAALKEKNRIKGECVIIVGPGEKDESPETENLDTLLLWYREQGKLSLRDSVKKICTDLNLPRSKVYGTALQMWEKTSCKKK